MANYDIIAVLGNLSQSLPEVNALLGGFAYILGIVFVVMSIIKFKEVIEESGSQMQLIVPTAYLLAGCGMLYLPTAIDAFSNTLFGSKPNILAYSATNQSDVYGSVTMLIQTAGFIWFIRGCVLLAHASHPERGREGSKGLGPKGFLFIVAGLFAMNIQSTTNWIEYLITNLMSIIASL